MSVIVAAAVCPQPPLLIPEIAGGAAADLDDVRGACDEAVRRLGDVSTVVVIGGGEATKRYSEGSWGDFRYYGVPDVRVGFGAEDDSAERLPVGLLVGAWLAARIPGVSSRTGQVIASNSTPSACVEAGRALAQTDAPVGLLVVGDGAVRRADADSEAEEFDDVVAAALGAADAAALVGLNQGLAADLRVSGRAPWQVLAGAAGDRPWRAELLYSGSPFGVGYLVASWSSP